MSDWDRQLLNSDSLRPLKPFNHVAATAALQVILEWDLRRCPARTLEEQIFPYGLIQRNPDAGEW